MEIITTTEQALIGSLLLSQKNIVRVFDIVKAEDFSTQAGRTAFTMIFEMWRKKRNIDIISVGNSDPAMLSYLSASTSLAFSPAAVEYSHSIAKAGKARRIENGLKNILVGGKSPDATLAAVLEIYQQEMSAGKKNPDVGAVLQRFENSVKANRKKGSMGFSTGFDFLENLHVEYCPGHIWTIGGWTSTGKTAVMIQKIVNMVRSESCPKIVVISTEMTEEQMISRMVANMTGVPSYRILTGDYHDAEEQNQADIAKSILAASKMRIYDDIYSLNEVETVFRKADLQGGVNVGFIDYVQNVRHPEAKSQYQEQSEIAKRVQKLAKDVKATIICLSQVSNDVGRGNTDQLELKGAGEWAAVSDIGIMLTIKKAENYLMKYQIKKNRHGARGEGMLEYKGGWTRLEEVTI